MLRHLLTIVLFWQLLGINVYAQNVHTFIPEKAFKYFPVVAEEQKIYFKELTEPAYIPALIEHESCISLKHSKCWNPSSELRTSREIGLGLGQLTKAYKNDGSIRFDSLEGIRNQHLSELKELSWSNIALRPDLQIRAIMLMSRDNYIKLWRVTDPAERINFADAAYNGGLGGVSNERRECGLRKGCDPIKWFGNVALVCLKSVKPIYSGRSACDINRHHVEDVRLTRMPKYFPYF